MENKLPDEVTEKRDELLDKSFKEYFSGDSQKELEDIFEYNCEKENFEKSYGQPYIDFSKRDVDEDINGKSISGYARVKDVAYSVGGNLIDLYQEMGEIGYNAGYGVAGLVEEGKWATSSEEEKKETWINPEKAYESKTGAGAIAGAMAKGVGGIATGGTALRAANITGKSGAVGKFAYDSFGKTKIGASFAKGIGPILEGMVGDGLAFWKDKENLSTFIKDNSDNELVKKMADYLAIEGDDSGAMVAFKQAAEGALMTPMVNAVIKGAKYIKAGDLSKSSVKAMETKLDDVVKEAKNKVATPKKESMSDVLSDIGEDIDVRIPRQKSAISYEEKVAKVKDKLSSEGIIDLENIDTDTVRKLVPEDSELFERTVISLENEEKIANTSADVLKEAFSRYNKSEISKNELTGILYKSIGGMADASGATKDILNEAGISMGLASKSEQHIASNKFLQYLVANADEITTDKLIKAFDNVTDGKDLTVKMQKMFDKNATKKGVKGWFSDIVNNFVAIQQSSLLSNPTTLTKNLASSVLFGMTDSIEKIPQSMVSSARNTYRRVAGLGEDTDIVRLREVGYNIAAMTDTVNQYTKELLEMIKTGKSVDSVSSKYKKDIGGASAYFGKQGDGEGGSYWTLTNYLTKYSGRTVADSTDNIFGYGFSKAELMATADSKAQDAINNGLITPEGFSAYKKDYINQAMSSKIDNDFNLSELKKLDKGVMDELSKKSSYKKSLEKGKEMTFRSGQGDVTKFIVKSFGSFPALRIAQPFISVISTITLDRGFADRTFMGIFSPRVRKQFIEGSGRDRDIIIGRQMLGNSVLLGTSQIPDDIITGDYSSDPKLRAMQKRAGFQPYSVKIGDSYYSYKESPIGVVMATGALIRDAINSNKLRDDDKDLLDYTLLAGQQAGKLALNESSAGIFKDLFDYTDGDVYAGEKVKNFLQTTATSVIPSWLSPMSGEYDDYKLKQVKNSFEEKLKTKIGKDTRPDLDFLGEPLEASSAWWGVQKTKMPGGYLNDKLQEIGAGFSEPTRTESIKGFSLQLDRDDILTLKQEIANIGTKDALMNMFDSDEFNQIDNTDLLTEDGKKAKKRELLSNTYNAYKRQALYNLIDNNERFTKLLNNAMERKIKDKGINPDALDGTSYIPTFTR